VTTTKRRPATRSKAKRKPPSAWARIRTALATHLGRQSDDVWGVVLLVIAAVAALGIYADLTGPAGRFVKDLAGAVLGWGRLLVPLGLAAVGGVLVSGRQRNEPARVAIGAGFLLVAATGLLDLGRGRPGLDDWTKLRDAGGLVGGVVAGPLESLLAVWGAALVLSALLLIGLLVITRTPVREATQRLGDGGRATGRVLHRGLMALLNVGGAPEEADDAADRHPTATRSRARGPKAVDQEPLDDEAEAPFDVGDEADGMADEPKIEVHVPDEVIDGKQLAIDLGPSAQGIAWRLPPIQLLKRGKAMEVDQRAVEAGARTLEDALAAHGVATRVVGRAVGPTVTRYELELGPGVKVAKLTSLSKDIAYAMASPDVRILGVIPGRSAIGIEVPNRQRQLVSLGDVLTTEDAHRAIHPLEVGLGRDIGGRSVMANLAEMPHILIAGATGAGKSSCINSLITSVLLRSTPDQVRMILVDPKRVELGQYNGLPHLLTQVVVNPKKAANALAWAVAEMDRRYDLLYEVGVRDVTGYNQAFDRGDLKPEPGSDKVFTRLPFILIVVDELNDLMMVAARDVEESICRLAQMARAVGIHLVIATQRPSVDVITGVIKANIPSRLAFAVSSLADSRVILDQPGAERLVGKGDMLLLTASASVARRIQGPWVSEDEVRKVVAFWRRQAQPQYVEGVEGDDNLAGAARGTGGDDDDDEMMHQAMELIVRSQLGSTSMLQRKLQVGFARAGRIMDQLERKGVVGPSEGSKPRAVLMTVEELESLQEARSAG
jgi:S-DNA-T family DNA segregation ATPase FtsK/SpoIIIE